MPNARISGISLRPGREEHGCQRQPNSTFTRDLQSVIHTLNIPVAGIIQTLGTHIRSSCSKLQLDIRKRSFASSERSSVQTQCFSLKEAEGINKLKLDHVTRRVKTGNSLGCFKMLSV